MNNAKRYIVTGIIVVGVSYCLFLIGSSFGRTEDPAQVVRLYFQLSEAGDLEGIRPLVTGKPPEYYVAFDKYVNLLRRQAGQTVDDTNDFKYDPDIPVRGRSQTTTAEIESVTPIAVGWPNTIRRNGEYIEEVTNVWTVGKEARVRVRVKSRHSSTFKGERDCLLYKAEGVWKIIDIDTPPVAPVYGMPNE
ncbi:MAG: hypothetical protein IPJ30_03865 [Acidobacteria bacterium]|nr:hypothetical protein [Acidobacteriota bacterium]